MIYTHVEFAGLSFTGTGIFCRQGAEPDDILDAAHFVIWDVVTHSMNYA